MKASEANEGREEYEGDERAATSQEGQSGRAPTSQEGQNGEDPPAALVLGGGCFWCLEAVYLRVRGVRDVQSGYAGGDWPDPSYRDVCSGRTGHAEVVRVRYDPEAVSLDDLLRIFFTIHDPTTPDRQGADRGTQYRSIILYADQAQKEAAERVMDEVEAEEMFDDPLVTQLEPLETFYPAEVEHDEYYERNPNAPYCQAVIAPKVARARRELVDLMRE